MPRNEGRDARSRERVRTDGKAVGYAYMNAGLERKLTDAQPAEH